MVQLGTRVSQLTTTRALLAAVLIGALAAPALAGQPDV
jgi:hypothetical protein